MIQLNRCPESRSEAPGILPRSDSLPDCRVPLVTTNWRTANQLHEAGSRSFVPVRISLGRPRHLEWTQVVPRVQELVPTGRILRAAEFDALYLAQLEKHGAQKIGERLASIFAEYRSLWPSSASSLRGSLVTDDCSPGGGS